MTGTDRTTGARAPDGIEPLNRASSVPLYYQLQELLKAKIESGNWRAGDSLPAEPELAHQFGISRAVVRQALSILEDDRQIVRVRGRGTLVAAQKMSYRAGGLSRTLNTPRDSDTTIQVLDAQILRGEPRIRLRLAVAPDELVRRVTTLLTFRGTPLAISYSYFRESRTTRLARIANPGGALPAEAMLGVRLARSELTVETSRCGRFEADQFGITHRSPVFLALCREFERTDDGDVPFEVARVECRGDILRISIDTEAHPTLVSDEAAYPEGAPKA